MNKRWHPSEIRIFKLNSKIECYGDAQGFHYHQKNMSSDIHLYHYGHVREASLHDAKQNEILKRIRPNQKFDKYKKRELKAFKNTKKNMINLSHPDFMKSRIERLGDSFSFTKRENLFLVDSLNRILPSHKDLLNVDYVEVVKKVRDVPKEFRKERMVILYPTMIQNLLYPSRVNTKMDSPLAREWDFQTYLLLKISEKGYSFKS